MGSVYSCLFLGPCLFDISVFIFLDAFRVYPCLSVFISIVFVAIRVYSCLFVFISVYLFLVALGVCLDVLGNNLDVLASWGQLDVRGRAQFGYARA